MPTTLDDLAQQVRLLRAGGGAGEVEGGEIVAYNATTGIATILLDDGTTITALVIPGGGGGTSSPLTTKGDVWGYSTVDARVPVGTDGTVLTADSGDALGVSWQTPTPTGPSLGLVVAVSRNNYCP